MPKYEVGETAKIEAFAVNPENLIIDPKDNGRIAEGNVLSMVANYLEVGRFLHPVGVQPIEGNKLKLAFGFRRTGAALYINKHIGDGVLEKLAKQAGIAEPKIPQEPILLPVVVSEGNAEEAFVANVAENKQREMTTDVDDAHNIRRLQEQFGWTDEKICAFYSTNGKPKSPAWLTQMKKILKLSKKAQDRMRKGEFAGNVAYYTADLPEKDRDEVLDIAKELAIDRTGDAEAKITMPDVVKAAKKKGVAKKTAKKVPEIKELLYENTGPARPKACREFCDIMYQWIDGKMSDKAMDRAFKHAFPADDTMSQEISAPKKGKKKAAEEVVV